MRTVVSRDYEHDDIGHIGAARAHRGERGMTRRIKESDVRAFVFDRIGTDMLRDPTGFARCNPRLANRIHERRLPMVDVPHECDDRSA
jgi:hypothetical protein